jgi:molybdenum cofactor cytidylyltransferase
MIFGRVKLADARGAILAHNLKTADRVLRKGALVDPAAYEMLAAAGHNEITVARLEPGDVPEGEAATCLGELLRGPGLRRSPDVHGRVNLFAEADGLLRLDAPAIERLNLIDESITLATLPDRGVVKSGDMIATLKIIPFAVSARAMEAAETLIATASLIALRRFAALKFGLVLTTSPQLKDAAIAHTITATRNRIEAHNGFLLPPLQTPHETAPLTGAINAHLSDGADVILISGASAVTDRQDVAPRAIEAAGGEITHFGMPVDPGNLICFGRIGARHAIVLPGCARSEKLNGIDWVLDLICAGEPVTNADIARMGVGGLLKEMDARPTPRAADQPTGFGAAPRAKPQIAAIILAAGMSRRMGHNKLLTPMPDGRTMIDQTVENVLQTAAHPVIVVTGHDDDKIREALAGTKTRFVHAPSYRDGMAESLRTGIAALSDTIGAALIILGDMPLVDPASLNRLLAAYDPDEGRDIIVPVFDAQRGNPVLWGKKFFPELLNISGDTGARNILLQHMESVAEIPMPTDAVLRDFDTPATLMGLDVPQVRPGGSAPWTPAKG